MNIILFKNSSRFYYFRPDISLNRDCNDYFCPEGIKELAAIPFIYIKMEKAAKAVSARFASRYYNAAGYGIYLSAKNLEQLQEPASWHTARSLDNTTYLSAAVPVGQFLPCGLPGTLTEILKAELPEPAADTEPAGYSSDSFLLTDRVIQLFNRKMEEITKFSSLRTGDLLCMEFPSAEKTFKKEPDTVGKTLVETTGFRFNIVW